ncbi:TPA: hypothetical protein NU463_004469 [Escherichia coli]|nr:hypothetical protein [Escherichia coli]HCJ6141144.1 hypothetical protein [Escherichia coli]HCJ8476635.1 hypothetical protein [Escherichia coli]HCJ9458727.1 hypothetical protein [Escherichia coli]HCJ9488251.1 hypothetical protein [Escherichia coli]
MITNIVDAAIALSTTTDSDERRKIAEEFRQRLPNWIFNNLLPDTQYAPFEGDDYYDVRPCTHELSNMYTEILNDEFDAEVGIKFFGYNLSASTYKVDKNDYTRTGIAINITLVEENGESHTETLYYRFHTQLRKLEQMVDFARIPSPEDYSESTPMALLQPEFIRSVCQDWIAEANCVDLVSAAARHLNWDEVRIAGKQILLVK